MKIYDDLDVNHKKFIKAIKENERITFRIKLPVSYVK